MSEQPVSPPDEAQAAVQAQLEAQAADLGGTVEPAAAPDLSAAHATQVDVDALMAQLKAQQDAFAKLVADAQAAHVVEPPATPSTVLTDYLDHNLPSWVHTVIGLVEKRLHAGGL